MQPKKSRYQVFFYRKKSGQVPAVQFLDRLPAAAGPVLFLWIDLMKKHGRALPAQYSGDVWGAIRFLKPPCLSYGLLYVFSGRQIIVLGGYRSKGTDVSKRSLMEAAGSFCDIFALSGRKRERFLAPFSSELNRRRKEKRFRVLFEEERLFAELLLGLLKS